MYTASCTFFYPPPDGVLVCFSYFLIYSVSVSRVTFLLSLPNSLLSHEVHIRTTQISSITQITFFIYLCKEFKFFYILNISYLKSSINLQNAIVMRK